MAENAIGNMLGRGIGIPANPLEGCKWLLLASQNNEPGAEANLKDVEAKLSDDQRAEARRLAAEFKPIAELSPYSPHWDLFW